MAPKPVTAPTLHTPRLVLRGVRPSDADAVAEGSGDERVAHFLSDVPSPYPPALAAQWIFRRIERAAIGRGPTLAITLAGNGAYGKLLGTVALRVHKRDSRAELGYWLRHEAWGQGIATEATAALVDWGFEAGLSKIYARVIADNVGSIRVLEKLGMVQEGLLRSHLRRGQALVDVLEFAVLAHEWRRT